MQYLNLFIQPMPNEVVFPFQSLQLHNIQYYNPLINSHYMGLVTELANSMPEIHQIQKYSQYGTLIHLKSTGTSYNAFAFARFRVLTFSQLSPFLIATVEVLVDEIIEGNAQTDILQALQSATKVYMENFSILPNALLKQRIDEEIDPNKLFYQVASRIQIPFHQKMVLFQMDDCRERIINLIQLLNQKVEQYTVNTELERKLKQELMSEMQNSGEHLINQTQTIVPQKQEIELDYQKQYVESLPWGYVAPEIVSIDICQKTLDQQHFGLRTVKERILQFLAVKVLTKAGGSIICLHGPPGVGKTSLGQSIAASLGRPFQKISLGGVSDEAQIRGHRKTYVGAQAGMIIEAIRKAKCINPVILLDEIDKVNQFTVGSALLEVLDPEQNISFMDNYVNKEFDLSQVLFVATANNLQAIQPALRDRLELIDIPSYTIQEKIHIAKQYLLPKQQSLSGVTGVMETTDEMLKYLITCYTQESGVRELERHIGSIMRKIALQQAQNIRCSKYKIDRNFIQQCLGESTNTLGYQITKIGMCKGICERVEIVEAVKMKGTGNFTQLCRDPFIIEQGQIAYSYIRTHFKHLYIDQFDIHVANAGCLGVSVAVAIISLLTKKRVKQDIVFAGELSLSGRILKQENLRDSLIQANGIKSIIIPVQNAPNIHNLESSIKEKVKMVDNIQEVLQLAFEDGFQYYHYPNL